ncbi:MAG TPA: amidase [Burkholderiaceae bacterium]|nr:amidase [Burkholderiaceae bacterium]
MDLHQRSAVELLALYARGDCSPVEVARDLIVHIERCEPVLHALWAFDAETLRAQARDSEARWRSGQARALDGVPVTVKENIATRGTPVPLGCAATALEPAVADAPPAARLREAGALIVAKTTMPDLGMLSSGLSSFHALARNPWNPALNPGGSSAGAGAACAGGYGPLHLGTDIGGSIRLPAGWCGIVGVKPSLGRIPIDPPYAGRVAGPMTRSVDDAALAMRVLSRPDPRDAMSLPWQDLAWHELDLDLRGVKLGLWLDAGWGLPVDPQARAVVEGAARAFEAAGAIVEPLAPFTTRAMVEGLDRFWRQRAWLDIAAWPPERRVRALPYIVEWAEGGAQLSGEQVFRGYSQMGAIRDATVAATRRFDAVLSPVSPVRHFPAEWPGPTNDPARPFEHIAFTLPFNFSEQPAVALNGGYDADGFPIGVQLATARHDDVGALRWARAWERLRPTQRPWPVVG